ncbi:MAG: heavy-metal-associated domain-containing protein, partial [Flavobacteriaceae bacterium]
MHTQEFTVTGMTCNNCRLGVLEKLSNLPEVAAAEVDLASGKTQLEVHQKVTAAYLSTQLGDKYTVDSSSQPFSTSPEAPSKLQQLFPLFLIFGYLIAGVIYLNYPSFKLQAIAHDFMGLFFIVFSFFKFLDYSGFPTSFAKYDPLAKRSKFYAQLYPFVESLLGLLFLFQKGLFVALLLT